ncbi:hypothetical protein [Metabacillus fastidiosus]|uniref:hypothetical protein n=1 Tax=Metabacillus fastidiosus TaxID=1458 RepID=UPI003D293E4B
MAVGDNNVINLVEWKYDNFNGVNLNNDNVNKKRSRKTPEEIRSGYIKDFMKLLSNQVN